MQKNMNEAIVYFNFSAVRLVGLDATRKPIKFKGKLRTVIIPNLFFHFEVQLILIIALEWFFSIRIYEATLPSVNQWHTHTHSRLFLSVKFYVTLDSAQLYAIKILSCALPFIHFTHNKIMFRYRTKHEYSMFSCFPVRRFPSAVVKAARNACQLKCMRLWQHMQAIENGFLLIFVYLTEITRTIPE